LNEKLFDHQIKDTVGITELSQPSDQCDVVVCHLDVGSLHPCEAAFTKGSTVR